MAKINFGGVEEEVITREEFPLEKAREVLKDEVVIFSPPLLSTKSIPT